MNEEPATAHDGAGAPHAAQRGHEQFVAHLHIPTGLQLVDEPRIRFAVVLPAPAASFAICKFDPLPIGPGLRWYR
jgi:hypothetical protein